VTEPLGPVVVGPDEGETIQGPVGGPLTFKVRGRQTNGALTAFENKVPPGQGPPLHAHAHEDELWYILEGDLRFNLDGGIRQAPSGSFVFVPRGTPHCFQNIGSNAARILVMFLPAGMEHFFERFAELSAPIAEDFATIGGPLGMTVLGPPLAQSHPQ
jgi:quercetin dioxygenase-like cupin family protein